MFFNYEKGTDPEKMTKKITVDEKVFQLHSGKLDSGECQQGAGEEILLINFRHCQNTSTNLLYLRYILTRPYWIREK